MTDRQNNDEEFKIHFIIGITGHRDIAPSDKGAIKTKIEEIVREVRKIIPNTPLLLLTPLAEGADRIAAEVAIEQNIDFIVPLPLPIEDYKKDFPDTIGEFNHLLNESLGHFELPIDESKIESIREYGPERDKRYEMVGAYIVQHSQTLIAVWDGKDTGLTGGTSQIVNFKLNGLPEEYTPFKTILDPSDTGPVYHITTRRNKASDTSIPHGIEMKEMFPKNKNKDSFFGKEGTFTKFDGFNKHSATLGAEQVAESRNSLALDVIDKERFISYIYANADGLAIGFKKKWSFLQLSLLLLLSALYATFLIYLYKNNVWLLIAYLVAYVTLLYLFRIKNPSHFYHNSFVQYRALAEGLRVLFFLRLGGIHEDISNHYLRKQRDKIQWIREVMRSANVFDPQVNPDFNAIKRYWLDDQFKYYEKSHTMKERKLNVLKTSSNVILFSTIFFILVAVILSLSRAGNLLHVIILLVISFPFLAGLIEMYTERNAFSEISKEHSRMKEVLGNAIQLWDDEKKRQEVAMELARETLRENADWLLLHLQLPEGMPI